MFLCLGISTVASISNKEIFKCAVCKKNCKEKKETIRNCEAESEALKSCFGLSCEGIKGLCPSCRRALHSYKKTGKTFFHVSFLVLHKI